MPEINHRLLKFCSPTNYALQNLESGVIYCQHFSAYNDPFEFWSRILSGVPDAEQEPERLLAALKAWGYDFSSIEQALKDYDFCAQAREYFDECDNYGLPFDQMRDEVRIACFGSEIDNLLMWSHYADGLRGFCIAFDESSVVAAEPEGYMIDVSYLDCPPPVDTLIYGISRDQEWFHQMAIEEEGRNPDYAEVAAEALKTMLGIWQNVFAVKPSEWKYERERRLLVQTDRSDTTAILRSYPHEAIKEVILGERMPDEYRSNILSILKEHYSDVPVKTARRAQGVYTLVID